MLQIYRIEPGRLEPIDEEAVAPVSLEDYWLDLRDPTPEDRQRMLLPRALLNALRRFSTTRNIQDVSSSTNTICEVEAERLESELSMIRYISWAIPSIGFIGTVRGIGDADIAVRHTKQSQSSQGGRIPQAMPIDLSNLALLDANGKATRVGFREEDYESLA